MNEYEWITLDEFDRRSREAAEAISPNLPISVEDWDNAMAEIMDDLPIRLTPSGDFEVQVRKVQDGMDTGDIDSYSRS